MGALLDALLALQDVELQLVDIRRQLRAKEGSVARQQARVKAADEALAGQRAELKRAQMQQDEFDVDLKAREGAISRLRDTLNTVKTNKEYAAVLSQLNNEKADRAKLETRAFELLEQLEGRKKQVAEHEEAVQLESRRLGTLEAQLAQARGSFAERLGALERQRTAAEDKLDAKSRDLFKRISERYEGEVLAKVVQIHPRRQEYMCEGCNMSLVAERANVLMRPEQGDVVTCDSCGRILYMPRGG